MQKRSYKLFLEQIRTPGTVLQEQFGQYLIIMNGGVGILGNKDFLEPIPLNRDNIESLYNAYEFKTVRIEDNLPTIYSLVELSERVIPKFQKNSIPWMRELNKGNFGKGLEKISFERQ